MAKFSGKSIIRAGETLISDGIGELDPGKFAEAFEILSAWRSCHVVPMEKAFIFLQRESSKVDRKAIVARRLKRTPSIIGKLRRYSDTGMKLKNMQDIGGCRVILASEKNVQKLVRRIRGNFDLNVKNDYIEYPKDDGYRSVHLVGRFPDAEGETRLIEVQARSAIQHAWATAVEITDLFTDQSIKTSQGKGVWRDFFRQASEQFAFFEGIPLFHRMSYREKADAIFALLINARANGRSEELLSNSEKLFRSMENLNVIEQLLSFSSSIKVADEQCVTAKISDGFVLLEIDMTAHRVRSRILDKEVAASEYASVEKASGPRSNIVIALVSTDSLGGLREAYPNYFADSTMFAGILVAFREAYKTFSPSGFFGRIFGR